MKSELTKHRKVTATTWDLTTVFRIFLGLSFCGQDKTTHGE